MKLTLTNQVVGAFVALSVSGLGFAATLIG